MTVDKELLSFVSGFDEGADKGPKRNNKNKDSIKETNGSNLDYDTSIFQRGGEEKPISIQDLTSVLADDLGFAHLKKNISAISPTDDSSTKSARKKKNGNDLALHAPLDTIQEARLGRQAAMEIVQKETKKWLPVIRGNRSAKQVVFSKRDTPGATAALVRDHLKSGSGNGSSLEASMNAALTASGMHDEDGIIHTEQMQMNHFTPEEIEKRYQDLAKKRALLFYQERKQKQQSKIKSKKFRKIAKKSAQRLKDKESRDDDESNVEELRLKSELARIKERMTLKTRKASQWAHQLLQKKKLESEGREEVLQQIRDKDRLRQEIYGKADEFQSSEDDDGDGSDGGEEEFLTESESNSENEHNDVFGGIVEQEVDDIFGEKDNEGEEKLAANSTSASAARRSFDPKNAVNQTPQPAPALPNKKPAKNGAKSLTPKASGGEGILDNIFPENSNNSLSLKKENAKYNGSVNASDSDEDAPATAQKNLIKRAFEQDKVFEDQFAAQKETEIASEAPQQIDLTLPGWGAWGGQGLRAPKGKVIKHVAGLDPSQRKDRKLSHVIIHERRSKKSAKLMLARQPFPHKSIQEYNNSVRQPIGKEWNSATSFTRKIKPRVQISVGSIIDPIRFEKKNQ